MSRMQAAGQGELDRVSQTVAGRIGELAERYATPLPQLTDEWRRLPTVPRNTPSGWGRHGSEAGIQADGSGGRS